MENLKRAWEIEGFSEGKQEIIELNGKPYLRYRYNLGENSIEVYSTVHKIWEKTLNKLIEFNKKYYKKYEEPKPEKKFYVHEFWVRGLGKGEHYAKRKSEEKWEDFKRSHFDEIDVDQEVDHETNK